MTRLSSQQKMTTWCFTDLTIHHRLKMLKIAFSALKPAYFFDFNSQPAVRRYQMQDSSNFQPPVDNLLVYGSDRQLLPTIATIFYQFSHFQFDRYTRVHGPTAVKTRKKAKKPTPAPYCEYSGRVPTPCNKNKQTKQHTRKRQTLQSFIEGNCAGITSDANPDPNTE